MTTAIDTLAPTESVTAAFTKLNANTALRHSFDITTVNAAASPYTVLTSAQMLIVDASAGAVTLNLPAAAGASNLSIVVVAKSVAGGNVVIDPSGAETVNGSSTKTLSAAYAQCRLTCDGTQWYSDA